MYDWFANLISLFAKNIVVPGLGNAELLVAVLVACGLLMIAVSSLLPKDNDVEWWEQR